MVANIIIGLGVSLGLNALSRVFSGNKKQEKPVVGKIEDFATQKVGQGWSLDRVYGKAQVRSCPIFWATEKREELVETPTQKEYRYYGTFAFAICDGYPNGIQQISKIKFNDQLWYNTEGALSSTAENANYVLSNHLEIRIGESNQQPTVTMTEYEEYDRCWLPWLCYCVVRDLPLKDFGNELPSQIDVELYGQKGIGDNVGLILWDAMQQVGLKPNVDFTQNAINKSLVGAILKHDGSGLRKFIDEIAQVHFLMIYQNDEGKIVITEEEQGNVFVGAVNIPYKDLGAGNYGDDIGAPYTETITNSRELSSEVSLNYVNANDNYSGGTGTWAKFSTSHHRPENISTALVMTPDRANAFCWRYLNLLWAQRSRFSFKVGARYMTLLAPGQFVNIELYPGDPATPMQLLSLQIGADFTVEFECVPYKGELFTASPSQRRVTSVTYTGSVIILSPNITTPPVIYNGNTLLVEGTNYTVDYTTGQVTFIGIPNGTVLDISYESKSNDSITPKNQESKYFGEPVCEIIETKLVDPTDPFPIYLVIKPDPLIGTIGETDIYYRFDTADYALMGTTLGATTVGKLATTLSSGSGIEPNSTATVTLDQGRLRTISIGEFDGDRQTLLIGNEHIGVKNATKSTGNNWNIGHFKRADNGTTSASHSVNTRVIVLRGINEAVRFNCDSDRIEGTLYIKLVPKGIQLSQIARVASLTLSTAYRRNTGGTSNNPTFRDTDFTVEPNSNNGVNTDLGLVNAILPDNPEDYTTVSFYDAAPNGSFSRNPLTIIPAEGQTVVGYEKLILNFNYDAVTLIYRRDDMNWSVYDGQTTTIGSGGGLRYARHLFFN